jgi:hypothetical protein
MQILNNNTKKTNLFKHCQREVKKTIVHYTLVHEFYLNEGVMFSTSCTNCFLFQDKRARVRVMVFNATFNNISVISWLSVLLEEEIGVPGENHRPVTSH